MAFDCAFTLVDDYARNGSKRFEGTATTLAQAITDAVALQADLAALTLAGAYQRKLSQTDTIAEAVEAGANLDAGATIHCRLNNGKMYAFKIPAFDPALLNPDGSVMIDNAAITDFIANFEVAGAYRVSEGNYVVDILYGELDR